MNTIHCPDMISYFEVKRALLSKGLVFINNQTIAPSRGSNYIRVDDMGLFALISKQEAHASNEPLLKLTTAL